METLTTPPAAVPRRPPGRPLVWLGLILGLLAPALYVVQLWAGLLFVPWYAAGLGTLAAALLVLALARGRTIWRIAGVGLLTLLAVGEWLFLLVFSRLPVYTGPVAVGQPFPAFAAVRADADSATFRQDDLRGDQGTVLVFFRGRW